MMTRRGRLILLGIGLAAGLTLGLWLVRHDEPPPEPPPPPPATQAATQPQGDAGTQAADEPPMTLEALYREHMPALGAALSTPVRFSEALRVELGYGVHLDPAGYLWVAHRRGMTPAEAGALGSVGDVRFVTDRPLYAHWHRDVRGRWATALVCADGEGAVLWLEGKSYRLEDRAYRWGSAFGWQGRMVVPADSGPVVIELGHPPRVMEHRWSDVARGSTVVRVDLRGLLAWTAWDEGSGSAEVVRWVDGAWRVLAPEAGWPTRTVHLAPMLDGSVLAFSRVDEQRMALSVVAMEQAAIDEAALAELIDQLADTDARVREAAAEKLAEYGPAAWPTLKRLAAEALPEAQQRVELMIRQKVRPRLGRMTLVDDRMRVMGRGGDGSVLLLATGGVRMEPREDEEEGRVVAPAWLWLQPGRPVMLLGDSLARELDAERMRYQLAGGELLVTQADGAVKRVAGNHLIALEPAGEKRFAVLAGIDRKGRWIFGEQAGTTQRRALIVDPGYADATPRLPVWLHSAGVGVAGWTAEGWPVLRAGGAFALQRDRWQALGGDAEVQTDPSEVSTTTRPIGPQPVLSTAEGDLYYGGRNDLRWVRSDGQSLGAPLPAEARGDGAVWLVRTGDGRLFLYNQPGRIVRLRWDERGESGQWVVEGVFTRNIPEAELTRMWVDPAGRICATWDGNRLAVMFPDGRVPAAFANQMRDE